MIGEQPQSEKLAAQDKVEERKANIVEAKFYNAFLVQLDKRVKQRIPADIDINTTELTLVDILSSNPKEKDTREVGKAGLGGGSVTESLSVIVKDSIEKARRAIFPAKAASSAQFKVDPAQLGAMTPSAFFKYLEELKASLIKTNRSS